MRTISATEAKQNFAATLDLSTREPVLIRRHDRAIAILIAPHLLETFHQHSLQEPDPGNEQTLDDLLTQLLPASNQRWEFPEA